MIKRIILTFLVGSIGYLIFVPPLMQEIKSDIDTPSEASVFELFDAQENQNN